MSISGVTGPSGAGISQYLAELLSQLEASTSAAASSNSNSTSSSSTSSTGQSTASVAVVDPQTPTLSDQVIGALVAIQMQDGLSSSTATVSNSSNNNPISQAFASLDADGDGTLSQSELETAIENAGGTASEADDVYAALGGTSTSGISESTFAQAAQAGVPPMPPDGGLGNFGGTAGPGWRHHNDSNGASQSASDEAAQIFSSLGISQDGSISQSQLASALEEVSSTGSNTTNDNSASGTSVIASEILSAFDNSEESTSSGVSTSTLDSQQQSQSGQSNYESLAQMVYQLYNATSNLLS